MAAPVLSPPDHLQGDFNRHVDYIHWNPVKHGKARQAADWPYPVFIIMQNSAFTPRHGAMPASLILTDTGQPLPRMQEKK